MAGQGRGRGTFFNREVKLLWSFIVAKWTSSKRFDVTMAGPIRRGHVKIAVSARYTDCHYVSHGINAHTRQTWFASSACNILPSIRHYASPLLLSRAIIFCLSFSFELPRNFCFPEVALNRRRIMFASPKVRRFSIFAGVFIRLTIRGDKVSGEVGINEARSLSFPVPCSNYLPIRWPFVRYDCTLRSYSMTLWRESHRGSEL